MPCTLNRFKDWEWEFLKSQADVKTQGDEGRNELRLLLVLPLSYHNSLTVFMDVSVSSHLACRSSCRLPEFHQLPLIHHIPLCGLALYCKLCIYEVSIVQILKMVNRAMQQAKLPWRLLQLCFPGISATQFWIITEFMTHSWQTVLISVRSHWPSMKTFRLGWPDKIQIILATFSQFHLLLLTFKSLQKSWWKIPQVYFCRSQGIISIVFYC